MQKEIVVQRYEEDKSSYTIEFGDGREVVLTIKNDSGPLKVDEAFVTPKMPAEEVSSTIDEASEYLLKIIRSWKL